MTPNMTSIPTHARLAPIKGDDAYVPTYRKGHETIYPKTPLKAATVFDTVAFEPHVVELPDVYEDDFEPIKEWLEERGCAHTIHGEPLKRVDTSTITIQSHTYGFGTYSASRNTPIVMTSAAIQTIVSKAMWLGAAHLIFEDPAFQRTLSVEFTDKAEATLFKLFWSEGS